MQGDKSTLLKNKNNEVLYILCACIFQFQINIKAAVMVLLITLLNS